MLYVLERVTTAFWAMGDISIQDFFHRFTLQYQSVVFSRLINSQFLILGSLVSSLDVLLCISRQSNPVAKNNPGAQVSTSSHDPFYCKFLPPTTPLPSKLFLPNFSFLFLMCPFKALYTEHHQFHLLYLLWAT